MSHPKQDSIYWSKEAYASAMQMYSQSLSQCPIDYESQIYQTAFGETHVLASGPKDASSIVILHGWNGNASGYYREYPFLLQRFRIYAVDVIGQTGRSHPLRLSTTNNDYAIWYESLLDAMKLETPHVIGFSGGGWITLKLMAFSPDRIGRAVLLSTIGLSSYTLDVTWRTLLAASLRSEWAIRNFGKLQVLDPDASPDEFDEFIKYLVPQFRHSRPINVPFPLSAEELSKIITPVLLLMGEHERLVNPQAAVSRALKTVPGITRAELIKDAGHLITFDQPDVVDCHITEFFRC